MGKKLSSLALCLVFLLGLMPNISLMAAEKTAKTPTVVKVGETYVYDDGKYVYKDGTKSEKVNGGYWTTNGAGKLTACEATDDWNVRYDAATHTLHLNNATIFGNLSLTGVATDHGNDVRDGGCGISADGDLKIRFKGDNRVTGTGGIFTTWSLQLDGENNNSTLKVTSIRGHGATARGISTISDLVVNSGKIEAYATQQSGTGAHVNGDLFLNGGSLTSYGGDGGACWGAEINGDVTVRKGATLKCLPTHKGSIAKCYGGWIKGNLTVDGGTVIGDVSGTSSTYNGAENVNAGLYVLGNLTLKNDGLVKGLSGNNGYYNYGVYVKKHIDVINGTLTGISGSMTNGKNSYGVYSESSSPIKFLCGKIVSKSGTNNAMNLKLPETGFYYRTSEKGNWKLGPDADFNPDKLSYAELATNHITVNYDANGGTGEMTEEYLFVKMGEESATLTVPKSEFTKDGYKFTGFKRSDNGEIVQPGAKLELTMKDLPSGFKLTAQWEKYAITEGTDSTWEKGSGKDLTIKSNAPFENFKEVQVDGKTVAKDNYTAKEGSTIITLKSAYLETLSPGEHTITILYTDGSKTDAKCTVKEKEVVKTSDEPTDTSKNNNVPQTGDTANILPFLTLSVGSVSILAAVMLTLKKRKENN